jgi:uncharacterized membrane protein
METIQKFDTQKLVLLAVLTAIVIALQLLAIAVKPLFPLFTITLVLVPIVIGAALCGIYAGAWLGLTFGVAVLISGDAAPFMAVNIGGTIVTVLLKGMLAGIAAGAVYRLLVKKNATLAVVMAAIACPVINTLVFILASYTFFLPTISGWAESAGFANATLFIFFGMIGINFLIEIALNMFLCPVIVRLVQYGQKMRRK